MTDFSYNIFYNIQFFHVKTDDINIVYWLHHAIYIYLGTLFLSTIFHLIDFFRDKEFKKRFFVIYGMLIFIISIFIESIIYSVIIQIPAPLVYIVYILLFATRIGIRVSSEEFIGIFTKLFESFGSYIESVEQIRTRKIEDKKIYYSYYKEKLDYGRNY